MLGVGFSTQFDYFIKLTSYHSNNMSINIKHFFLVLLGVPQIDGDVAFLINSTTGDITVNAKLDYESGVSSYSLFVKVSPILHVQKIILL